MKAKEMILWRSSSCRTSTSHHSRSSSSSSSSSSHHSRSSSSSSSSPTSSHLIVLNHSSASPSPSPSPLTWLKFSIPTSTLLRSLLIPTCRATGVLTRRRSHVVTGTLFGNRKGHVTFAVQDHPNSPPLFLIQLPPSTSALVKEMSSGLLRIALESHNNHSLWTMYCNGRKCTAYAASRAISDSDLHLFKTIQTVSAGAGVIPQLHLHADELLYMRARFERVVGSRHSEAFYMLNPDGSSGPDLSIFLLR